MDKRVNSSIVYFSLGSNLGDKTANLNHARTLIAQHTGEIFACSRIYQTAAWEMQPDTPLFFNQVIGVTTPHTAVEILQQTQAIEKMMGRQQKSTGKAYQNRIIDIDILFYDDMVYHSPTLTIPHPLLHKRKFVLSPLNEIAPRFIHPQLRQPVWQLLQNCTDPSAVIPV